MNPEDHFWKVWQDTAPEKLPDMPDDELDACHRFFVDRHPNFSGRVYESKRLAAEGRIALLRNEIERRRTERMSAIRHDELIMQGDQTFGVGKDTLQWTKVAASAAIVGVLIGAIALGYQIATSRNQLAPTAIPFQQPLRQMKATKSESPAQAAATSTSTPSPLPMGGKESPAPP